MLSEPRSLVRELQRSSEVVDSTFAKTHCRLEMPGFLPLVFATAVFMPCGFRVFVLASAKGYCCSAKGLRLYIVKKFQNAEPNLP